MPEDANNGLVINSGVYVAVFYLPTNKLIQIGQLGRIHLHKGFYFYAGSAQKHLQQRLARHSRRDKRLHWHIDYLSTVAIMLGALVYHGSKSLECRLAGILASHYDCPVEGFGCSDCRYRSHLFTGNY